MAFVGIIITITTDYIPIRIAMPSVIMGHVIAIIENLILQMSTMFALFSALDA